MIETVTSDMNKEPKPINLVSPWTRFWARTFDVFIHTLIIVIIWTIIHEGSLSSINDRLFSILFIFCWIFFEGLYFSFLGTTPGKAIYGIKITSSTGTEIDKYLWFKRARLVWFRGMGMGLSLVQIVTHIVAYRSIEREGITTWDRDLDLIVSQKEISSFRSFICPGFIIGISILLGIIIVFF